MSKFRPASSRTTCRPPSVSSLTAHEPEAPEPTTMASYVDSLVLIRVCLVRHWGGDCLNRAARLQQADVFRGTPPSLHALAGAGLYSTAAVSPIDYGQVPVAPMTGQGPPITT